MKTAANATLPTSPHPALFAKFTVAIAVGCVVAGSALARNALPDQTRLTVAAAEQSEVATLLPTQPANSKPVTKPQIATQKLAVQHTTPAVTPPKRHTARQHESFIRAQHQALRPTAADATEYPDTF